MLPLSAVERYGAAPNAPEILMIGKLRSSTILIAPGLPKNIEKGVMLWRRGEVESGIIPIRMCKKAKSRTTSIKNNSNSSWASSGRKYTFIRLGKVIALIVIYGKWRGIIE